jgi:pimeloyl-ACP methyl ester carboxylesterase
MTAPAGDGWARAADGVPIRFEVEGTGDPTLLLVHGWAFDRRLWEHEVPRLARRHRVVTLDLPGHGESGRERKDWTIASYAGDVKSVADAAGAARFVLVGHSMGGLVSVEAARRMPDRVLGLLLVDILLDVEQRTPPEVIDSMERPLQADYVGTVKPMAEQFLLVPATPKDVRERVTGQVAALPADLSIALLREVWTYDPLPALAEIRAPIRAVNADMYPTNLEANRRHMPGYEATIVPGTGHYPMLEVPDRFAPAFDRTLAALLAAVR